MYFLNNKPQNFEITRAIEAFGSITSGNDFSFTYQFDVQFDNVPNLFNASMYIYSFKSESIDVGKDDVIVKFEFILYNKNSKNYKPETKQLLKLLNNYNVKNYFFLNPKNVKFSYYIDESLTDNEGSKQCDICITLKGKLKFDVYEEFHLSYAALFESKLKTLNNKDTINYFLKRLPFIKKEYRLNNYTHEALNQLTEQFDVNSNDFFEALKLRYDY